MAAKSTPPTSAGKLFLVNREKFDYPPSQKATGVNPWLNARWVPSVALAKEGALRRVPPYEACGEEPRPPGLRSRSYFGEAG